MNLNELILLENVKCLNETKRGSILNVFKYGNEMPCVSL